MISDRAAATRRRLQDCALELFERHGYDGTSVDQIAAAAGVSHMTFFRHFPTKEAVLLDDPYDPVLADAVAGQPLSLPALERVRRGLAQAWRSLPEPAGDETRRRVRLVADHAALRAAAWENNRRTEDAVVDALVRTGVERREAVVAAGACLGAVTAALLEWGRDADGALGDRLLAALAQLEPGTVQRAATATP